MSTFPTFQDLLQCSTDERNVPESRQQSVKTSLQELLINGHAEPQNPKTLPNIYHHTTKFTLAEVKSNARGLQISKFLQN